MWLLSWSKLEMGSQSWGEIKALHHAQEAHASFRCTATNPSLPFWKGTCLIGNGEVKFCSQVTRSQIQSCPLCSHHSYMCLVLWIISLSLKEVLGTFLFMNFLLNNKHLRYPLTWSTEKIKSIGKPRRKSVKLSNCQDLVNFIKKPLDTYISNTLHFIKIWHFLRRANRNFPPFTSEGKTNKQKTQKRKKKKKLTKNPTTWTSAQEYCRILLTWIHFVLEKLTAKVYLHPARCELYFSGIHPRVWKVPRERGRASIGAEVSILQVHFLREFATVISCISWQKLFRCIELLDPPDISLDCHWTGSNCGHTWHFS